MTKKNKIKLKFAGFPENYIKTFWKYPRMLEGYWYMLSGSEQKILDFILRQTVGFSKDSDKISQNQFLRGIGEKNKGVGLAKSTIVDGIDGLIAKGFIWVKKTKNRTSEYGLVVQKLDNQKLDKSCSNLGWGGSKIGQGSGLNIEHTIDNNNKEYSIKEIERIFSLFKEKICPDSRLTREGKKLIAERLKEYSSSELETAIDNFSNHEWYMNEHGFRGVKWFFQSEDQIDTFKNIKLTPANGGKEILRRGSYG